MLFQLLCIYLWTLASEAFPQEDLQIVGSNNHFKYQPRVQAEETVNESGFYRPRERFGKIGFMEPDEGSNINFPVKTVQKFTDSDGNIKIVTSYSNRDDNPLPIYKDVLLRQKGLEQVRSIKPVEGTLRNVQTIPKVVNFFPSTPVPPQFVQIEPRSRPTTQQYSTTKTVQLPNQDGQLFADQHETSSSDGISSSYNQKSSYNHNYKKPHSIGVQSTATSIPVKQEVEEISNTPLDEAGSSYVSDIDDSSDIGEQSFNNDGSEGGHGYSEGLSSYSTGEVTDHNGGDEAGIGEDAVDHYDGAESHGGYGHDHGHGHSHGHAFKKGHGSSYHHGNKGSKGDGGGKGFKSKEQYEKGHAESHGHEEEKGGKKEESGAKTGHLDEANEYAKGHTEAHGSKESEQGHSKGHKKGHKTKGFRTVHHKDEYKKDEVFYDEEHDAGHQKGQGQDHHSHKHAKGGDKKKGHLESGYKHAQKGFHGDKEKGHSYKNAKGHSGKHGSQKHHSHHSHQDNAAGHKGSEAHGHEHESKGH